MAEIFDGSGTSTGIMEGLDVSFRIGDVLGPSESNGGEGAWTKAEVVFTAPAGGVVTTFVTLLGVVRDFVLMQPGRGQELHDASKKAFLRDFIAVKFAGAEFFEELGVLLVSQAVGGNVVGRSPDGFMEIRLPFLGGLIGDGEHEVDVHGRELSFAEDGEAFVRLSRGVDSSEGFERFWVPGLDPEADAIDAELTEQLGFLDPQRGGVGLEGPFFELGEIHHGCDIRQEKVELFDTQGGWGSAAEIEGFWLEGVSGGGGFHLCNERVQECVIFVFGAFFEIETAVRAGFWAEGDVEIEMFNDGGLHGGMMKGRCLESQSGSGLEMKFVFRSISFMLSQKRHVVFPLNYGPDFFDCFDCAVAGFGSGGLFDKRGFKKG